jgi:hypothetical protein
MAAHERDHPVRVNVPVRVAWWSAPEHAARLSVWLIRRRARRSVCGTLSQM